MQLHHIKLIESAVVAIIYLLVKLFSRKLIDKTMASKLVQKSRGKIVKKVINIIAIIICATLILIIWGVNQSELAIYVGSILTVVGVALFAQWSILSNVTSSLIIFFSHAVKLEDTIIILEAKDYEIEGRVSDIGLFFITLKTPQGEEITLPNNIFIQKTIKKKLAV